MAQERENPDSEAWAACVGAPTSDVPALEAAIEADSSSSAVCKPSRSGAAAEVVFEVRAASFWDAVAQVQERYSQLRGDAGLPASEPLYGFVGPAGTSWGDGA